MTHHQHHHHHHQDHHHHHHLRMSLPCESAQLYRVGFECQSFVNAYVFIVHQRHHHPHHHHYDYIGGREDDEA
eukprot:4755196-Karenia_brevis.AAC.1